MKLAALFLLASCASTTVTRVHNDCLDEPADMEATAIHLVRGAWEAGTKQAATSLQTDLPGVIRTVRHRVRVWPEEGGTFNGSVASAPFDADAQLCLAVYFVAGED